MAGGRRYSLDEDVQLRAYFETPESERPRGALSELAKRLGRTPANLNHRWQLLQQQAQADSNPEIREWAARREAARQEVSDKMTQLLDAYRPVDLVPIPLPRTMLKAGDYVVVSSDHHWPLQDPRAEAIILQTIERLRPRKYILNGDGPDMLNLSAFPKDARHGRSWQLREEQQHAKNWWWQVAALMKQWNGELFETEANHSGNEAASRWRRWLNDNCPILFQLDGFEEDVSYQRYFHPKDAGVQMVDEVVIANDLRIRHGELARKHGGYSARAHGDKWQSSVMHGHTHRIGSSMKRRPGIPGVRPDEFLRTFETGCACMLNADYCPGADWQQGFAIIHVDPASNDYGVELVQIVNGRATSTTLGGTIAA